MTQILIELVGTALAVAGTVFGVLRFGPSLRAAQRAAADRTPEA